jgi:hypothetical protein
VVHGSLGTERTARLRDPLAPSVLSKRGQRGPAKDIGSLDVTVHGCILAELQFCINAKFWGCRTKHWSQGCGRERSGGRAKP